MVIASQSSVNSVDADSICRSCDMEPDELLRQVLATMPSGLFTVDPLGRITTWNQAMEHITGYPAAQVLGRPCAILRGNTCFQGPLGKTGCRCPLFDGEPVEGKRCTLVRSDGQAVTVHKNARLMRDATGGVIGGIEAINDLTTLLQLEREVDRLRTETSVRQRYRSLVGSHRAMQRLYDLIDLAGRSASSVLVLGETGTGKELVARAIHDSSTRRHGPFVRVSCAALSETLLESELFGHVRDAFTGAVANRAGRFEAADGGTIFLDEIGDISPLVQSKLLRVLQEHEVERVGENRPIRVDIRVLAATNRDLKALTESGAFRSDLYYRLAVIPVTVPPLRERREDIPLLVEHFVSLVAKKARRRIRGVTAAAMAALEAHAWPGNVRELEHALEYGVAVAGGEVLDVGHLPPSVPADALASGPPQLPASARRQGPDRARIVAALTETGGNRSRAAAVLGVSRVTLWKWIKVLGLE